MKKDVYLKSAIKNCLLWLISNKFVAVGCGIFFVLVICQLGLKIQPASAVCAGHIYYMDATDGLDTNDGCTALTAWKTFAKLNAPATFSPGDQILFQRGETFPNFLNPPSSGSGGSLIVYSDYPDPLNLLAPLPIITGGATYAITIRDRSYLKFQNLQINVTGLSNSGIYIIPVTTGSNHIVIDHIDFIGSKNIVGISATGVVSDFTMSNLTFPGIGASGTAISFLAGATASNISITDTNISNIGAGISLLGATTGTNVISGTNVTGCASNGLTIAGASSGFTISNSTFSSNLSGIRLSGTTLSDLILDNVTTESNTAYGINSTVTISGTNSITNSHFNSNGSTGISMINVSGLTITDSEASSNGPGTDNGIALGGAISDITIDNLTANSNAYYGLVIDGTSVSNIEIFDSTFTYNATSGIVIDSVDGLIITDTIASNNIGGKGLSLTGDIANITIGGLPSVTGITANENGSDGLSIDTTSASNVNVSNSTFNFNGNYLVTKMNGVQIQGTGNIANLTNVIAYHNYGDGFNIHNNWTNVTLDSCTAEANGTDGEGADGDGFSYHDNTTGTMRKCISKNNLKTGAAHVGSPVVTMENCKFSHTTNGTFPLIFLGVGGTYYLYNNTIYSAGQTGIMIGSAADTILKNNIIYGGSIGIQSGLITEAYNLVYGAITSYDGLVGSPTDINSDPLFNNPGALDFSLQASSPAIDAGEDVNINTDYAGKQRYDDPDVANTGVVGSFSKTYVDIGVYEYVLPPNPVLTSSSCPNEAALCNDVTPDMSLSSATSSTTRYHYLVNQTAVPLKADVEAGTLDDDGIFTVPGGVITGDGTWYVHIIAQNLDNDSSTNFDTYTLRIDTDPPTVIITTAPGTIYEGALTTTITATYNEAMNPLTSPVIVLSGGTFGVQIPAVPAWTESNSVYTATFIHTAAQERVPGVTATIAAASGATDEAGNPEVGGVSAGFLVDTEPPNAATALNWAETSPHNATSVTASWTKSDSVDFANQKIQFYADATCTIASGILIDLASNAVHTEAFIGVNGSTYTYKITSIDGVTNETVSGCSSPMLIDTDSPTVIITTAPGTIYEGALTTTITATYNEAMNPLTSPVILLSGGTFGAQIPAVPAWTVGDTVYTATFIHTVAQERVTGVTATIAAASGATDEAGNPEVGGVSAGFLVDTQKPTVSAFSPADGATGVGITQNLILTFSENVVVGTGNVLIKKISDDSTAETIDIAGGQVTFNGTTGVTIDPSISFQNGISYYVQIANDSIKDLAGNAYAGIADTTTWNFTTVFSFGGGSYGAGDTTPPTNTSISINSGAVQTSSQSVTLTLGATDAIQMIISNSADFANIGWEPYATSKIWSLAAGTGIKTVYVKFKDASGNTSVAISDTIDFTASGLILQDPTPAPALPAGVAVGTLVKRADISSVYFIDQDNRRHTFPNEKVFFSYYPDFSDVLVVSDTTLAAIPMGRNVTVRPGTWLVKIQSDPKVYAVEPYGVLRGLDSMDLAVKLYGSDWANNIIDVSPAFFTDYQLGTLITTLIHPTAVVIKYQADARVYYIDNSNKMWISSGVFQNNLFQDKFILANFDQAISYSDGEPLVNQKIEDIIAIR